ncbi:hypothetical protein LIA77_08897 [Sarocladium implicatum]|nr:hypothetical protein LIA77_08897 [Sarocladium implicatum]
MDDMVKKIIRSFLRSTIEDERPDDDQPISLAQHCHPSLTKSDDSVLQLRPVTRIRVLGDPRRTIARFTAVDLITLHLEGERLHYDVSIILTSSTLSLHGRNEKLRRITSPRSAATVKKIVGAPPLFERKEAQCGLGAGCRHVNCDASMTTQTKIRRACCVPLTAG